MKKLRILFVLTAALVFTTGCKKINAAKGDITSHDVPVSGTFNAIDFGMVGELTFVEDSTVSLSIETNEKVMEVIEVYVENSTLMLTLKNGYSIKNGEEVKVRLTAPDVNEFICSGSGLFNATVDSTSHFTSSKVVLSGSGEMEINQMSTDYQEVIVSGSGSVTMQGESTSTKITLSGSGEINTNDLTSDVANAILSGSGNIYVQATTTLNATISGSGNIYYKDYPQINSNVTGSGNIFNGN